jgi:hypothetical protein
VPPRQILMTDFSPEYDRLSDDELLALASTGSSLTDVAKLALDRELSRRNLTDSERIKYEQFVNKAKRRDTRRLQRKIFGSREDLDSWVNTFIIIFWSALALSLIGFAYRSLPVRYQLAPDWKEAAISVMFVSVPIAVGGFSFWRSISFWTTLFISSILHLLLVRAWIIRMGALTSGRGGTEGWAWVVGFLLFFVVLGFGLILKRNILARNGDR